MAASTIDEIVQLHAEVDRETRCLAGRHAERLQCRRGCHPCCVDDITVFDVEAERIRRVHPELLDSGRPHPPGACAFLNGDGACRVYEERPYVCRTQGLPLRWFDEDDATEYRDICPLNDLPGEPLESLPECDCWTLGAVEGRLMSLQIAATGAPPRRVPLRSLFRQSDGPRP